MGDNFVYENRNIETTEWEDVLVKKNIIQERQEVIDQRNSKKEIAARGFQNYNRDRKTIDEILKEHEYQASNIDKAKIDELEDNGEDDIIIQLRSLRLKELKLKSKSEVYGEVLPIYREEFIKEVTQSSNIKVSEYYEYSKQTFENVEVFGQWVVVELYKDGFQGSNILTELLRNLARIQRSTKFVRIKSTECVENWPDSKVPTIFLYFGGSLRHTIVGLADFGGAPNISLQRVEWILAKRFNVFAYSGNSNESPFQTHVSDRHVSLHLDSGVIKHTSAHDESDSEEEPSSDDEW